jgi:hypothetical protein
MEAWDITELLDMDLKECDLIEGAKTPLLSVVLSLFAKIL